MAVADVREMSHLDFIDWAERFERDVFRVASRRDRRYRVIRSDSELALRSLSRRLMRKRSYR